MAHYRTMLTSDNLMAADLWDDKSERYTEWIVQILSVARGEVVGDKGRKKGMPFIKIANQQGREHPKPLGLNATNCETIRTLTGSPDVKRWGGVWVTLYVTQTDSKDGKRDCIRIRPEVPKVQPPKQSEAVTP